MTSLALADTAPQERSSAAGRSGTSDANSLPGRNVRCLITTDEVTDSGATVHIVGVLEKNAAYLAEQVVRGHLLHGRQSVRVDLTAVTHAEPAAIAILAAMSA